MMDYGEQALLASTIDEIVASADGANLTAALDDFGWSDLLESSPELAISTVFSALGRFVHWSSALHDVMGLRLDEVTLDAPDESTVLIPWPRNLSSGTVSGNSLTVKGLLLHPRSESSIIVVVAEGGGHTILAVSPGELSTERREGLDPSLGALSVSGASDRYRVLLEGDDGTRWWNGTIAFARIAICYSLSSSLVRMVEFATEHATSRRQFGRPIGSFQAIRHRAADSLVASDAAATILSEVWRSDNFELAAAVAKLVVSNSTKVVAAHVQQILAGIGFTVEHEFHRYMKRAIILDRLFDSSIDLAGSIGSELVTLGRAPRLFEL